MHELDLSAGPATHAAEHLDDPLRRAAMRGGLAALALAAGNGWFPDHAAGPVPVAKRRVQEYKVVWQAERLDALRRRIGSFAFPRPIPGSGWKYGIDADCLRALIDYWGDGFDMEGAARTLNRSARAARTRRGCRCSVGQGAEAVMANPVRDPASRQSGADARRR